MTTEQSDAIRERLRSVVIIRVEDGQGTGFYASDSGILVTNRHVVGDAEQVAIRRFDHTRTMARVIRRAQQYDLALLLDDSADRPPPLSLADSASVASGREVFAIGHPVGLDFTVTRGIVSSSNRRVKGVYYVQTDAVAHPGSSGGPLLDNAGNVIGVSTFGLDRDGLNFALSVRYVSELLGEVVVPVPARARKRKPAVARDDDVPVLVRLVQELTPAATRIESAALRIEFEWSGMGVAISLNVAGSEPQLRIECGHAEAPADQPCAVTIVTDTKLSQLGSSRLQPALERSSRLLRGVDAGTWLEPPDSDPAST